MKKPYIETGKIVGTHGVKGEMRLNPWSDTPQDIIKFKKLFLDSEGKAFLQVDKMRVHGNIIILKANNIDDIASAEKYRNKIVFVKREDFKIEKGKYFIQDLIDCKVYDETTKECYGVISDVSQTGANDVWHIKTEKGAELLIPSIPDVVKKVDTDNGVIIIKPLEGLFE